jgi:hypothetical protein
MRGRWKSKSLKGRWGTAADLNGVRHPEIPESDRCIALTLQKPAAHNCGPYSGGGGCTVVVFGR